MIRLKIRELLLESEKYRATGEMPSLEDVANEAGLSRQLISNMCKPGYATSTANVEKLLRYFNIGPHDLHRLIEYTVKPEDKLLEKEKAKPKSKGGSGGSSRRKEARK